MMRQPRPYPAKVLLFGEYALLAGSPALALPYLRYSTLWQTMRLPTLQLPPHKANQQTLIDLSQYLLDDPSFASYHAAILECQRDVLGGRCLVSDIPQGYGLGSSGAVCAAICDAYMQPESSALAHMSLADLLHLLAKMEVFFHGKSSGIDPLVSYLNKPILYTAEKQIQLPKLSNLATDSRYTLFLLDTNSPRKTGTFVQNFVRRLHEDKGYKNMITRDLCKYNEIAVLNFCRGDFGEVYEAWKQISAWQYQHFADMIPTSCQFVWERGCRDNNYYLKLCGAGGGGFLLGISTAALSELQAEFNPFTLLPLDFSASS